MKYYHLESMFFHPVIMIEDMADRHWENCKYFVHEVEDEFSLKCEDFDYEWITISD